MGNKEAQSTSSSCACAWHWLTLRLAAGALVDAGAAAGELAGAIATDAVVERQTRGIQSRQTLHLQHTRAFGVTIQG